MTKHHLDIQLKDLQEGADAQYDTYRRSHEQLWGLLAKSYLWWREASKEQGYLESLYEKRKIDFRASQSNTPNFSPLIRLVWNMETLDSADRVTVSQWNKALQAMDEHYLQNPAGFRQNAKGKLAAFIQKKGGVAGLIENVRASSDDDDIDVTPSRGRNRVKIVPNPNVQAEISRLALTQLKAEKKGIGSVATKEPVRVGGDGLLVLLARRESNGRLTVLGSSNDPKQIHAVAASIVNRDLTNLSPNLRSLVEIIATQTFPSHALPSSPNQRAKWYRTKYADKSDLYESDLDGWKQEGRDHRLTSSKQLLLRGKGQEAIFSWSRVAVSPVTRCILHEPLVDKNDTVFLRVIERSQIEQWLETGEVAVMHAETKKGLKKARDEERAMYKLPVTNSASGFTKFLHFYDHAPEAKKTHYQADFKRGSFKANWEVKLNTEWFTNLRQVWADRWFAELGSHNQIGRKNNATLVMKVSPKKLYVFYNRHPDVSPSEHFDFPTQIERLNGTQTTAYLSKDLAPILFNLANASINGAVTMAGNCHAVVFKYASQIGRFEIAVPTLDAKEKHRDGTLFYPLGRG